MNRFFHVVPWYVSIFPYRWQVAWIWLAWMQAGNPAVYPGDLEHYFKSSQSK